MIRNWHAAGGATHAILRIVVGLMFMLHGGQKLFGWFGGPTGQGGTVELASLMGLAGMLELVGGALIIVGLFTRPVAFILSGEMAVAYFMVHFPNGFWPIENRGEAAALYSFLFLFFAFNGAGPFSADALREDRVTDAELDELERDRLRRRSGRAA
jgi:putative oxidoreductase